MSIDDSNFLFDTAARFVHQTNRHLFLTGKAGTGKTTFLKYIRENGFKNMAIVAPTGVAAINAAGVTMHSFFQLPFGPFIPDTRNNWNDNLHVADRHSLFKGIRFSAEKRELLRELELLIIDEVSMLRADMLDAVDVILRHFRLKPNTPFGGIQVLYIGDLYQLPPVINQEEWHILKNYYKSPFFFDAHVIREAPPLFFELKKIYRQSEQDFIDILNNIRNNRVTQEDLAILHKHYRPGFRPSKDDHYITLTTHNVKADAINRKALNDLPGNSITYEGKIQGDFSDRSLPADRILHLKPGAQVMFIRNDKGGNRRFFNGKIATVSRLGSDNVYVTFPGESAELEVEKETWQNIRYTFNAKKNTIEEDELGTFTQYPLRLAWAITIHKSQGLTFDKAIIDAGESFAAGQVYVALSRLSRLEGLILYSRIYPESISTDERIVAFTMQEKQQDELTQILHEDERLFIQQLLLNAFEWNKLKAHFRNHLESYEDRTIPDKIAATQWAKNLYQVIEAEQEVALKFVKQLQQLISYTSAEGYLRLYERMKAASDYFCNRLSTIKAMIQDHIREYQPKKRIKKYIEDCRGLNNQLLRKQEELHRAVKIAQGLYEGTSTTSLRDLLQSKEDPNGDTIEPVAVPRPETIKGTTRTISLELFKEGKSIRDIAESRGLAMSTIESHLATFISTGEIDILELVPETKIQPIINAINAAGENEGAGIVKTNLGDNFSYGEIKAVREYLKVRNPPSPVI